MGRLIVKLSTNLLLDGFNLQHRLPEATPVTIAIFGKPKEEPLPGCFAAANLTLLHEYECYEESG